MTLQTNPTTARMKSPEALLSPCFTKTSLSAHTQQGSRVCMFSLQYQGDPDGDTIQHEV